MSNLSIDKSSMHQIERVLCVQCQGEGCYECDNTGTVLACCPVCDGQWFYKCTGKDADTLVYACECSSEPMTEFCAGDADLIRSARNEKADVLDERADDAVQLERDEG